MQKLLVDENLSPSLVGLAADRGFVCSHVNHLGLTGQKDWQLKTTILDGDWTFITNNGVDFRGSAKKPGSQGVYADVPLHAGLVCVDAPGGLNLESQKRLFELARSRKHLILYGVPFILWGSVILLGCWLMEIMRRFDEWAA